jgi:hypothetical protein
LAEEQLQDRAGKNRLLKRNPMIDFPQVTPPGANVTIKLTHDILNYASHTGKSLSKADITEAAVFYDFHIVRTGEQKWNYYLPLLVDFNRKLRMETLSVFSVENGYEDVLYTKATIDVLLRGSMAEFHKKLKEYGQQNDIKNVPAEWGYSEDLANLFCDKLAERINKYGLVSTDTSEWVQPFLKIPAGSPLDSIFSITYHLINLLVNDYTFDVDNNMQQILWGHWMVHPAGMLFLKHKCIYSFGKDSIVLNRKEALYLSLHIELAMQCMVGQIWSGLEPLTVSLWSEMPKEQFLQAGRDFYTYVKDALGEPPIDNYSGVPLWDEVLQ